MKKSSFIQNTSWIITGQILKLIIAFFISVISARYLGPSNIGIINYVNSYIAFFTSIIGLGLNGVIIYEFAHNPQTKGSILGTAIILRFIIGLLSTVIFLFFMYRVETNNKTILIVAALQAIQLPFLCLDTINYWYQSNMQSKYSTFSQSIAYIFTAAYKVFLLITGKSVTWFAFAVSLDFIILGIAYVLFYNKHKDDKLGISIPIAKRLLISCLPFILANIMVTVYAQIDKIMIRQMMESTRQVGLYSIAIVICNLIGFLPIAILDSARPLVAEAQKKGSDAFNLRFKQLAAGIFWICSLYSLFITLASKQILTLLYGNDYLDANNALKIAVWFTAFSYLGSAKNFWLICENKKRFVFIFSALGALINIIMNIILIPLFGIEGAALATLTTQIFSNFIIPSLFKETQGYSKIVLHAILLKDIELYPILLRLKSKLNKKGK